MKTLKLIIVVFVLIMFGCGASKDTKQVEQWKGKYKYVDMNNFIVDTAIFTKIPSYIIGYDTLYIINNGEITDTLVVMRKTYIN